MGTKKIRFERQKLFEQIWEKPMTALAAEFGLSDVGLRKICKRLNIPLPPQGYHLRTHKGQRPPLPPAKDGVKEYVTHIYEPEQLTVNDLPQLIEIPEITFEEQPENRILVPDVLPSLHHHVNEAKKQLSKDKPGRYGRVSTYRNRGNDISVFPESIDRALRVMNTLVKALVKRGYAVSVDDKVNATLVKVLDEKIGLRLEERARKARHVPTPAEIKEEKRLSYRSYPTYDYVGTGELSLKISGAYGYEQICIDDKKGRIEEKLNLFIIALIKRALKIKDERIRRTREEGLRQNKERRRWEIHAMARKEKEKLEALKKECEAWHESQKLREYILAAYKSCPSFDPESPFAKWLVWASLQADRLDPLKYGPPSVLDYDHSYW